MQLDFKALPVVCTILLVCAPTCADEVTLAEAGKALVPVRVAADASERMVALAEEVRQLLSKMSASEFRVERQLDGDGLRLQVVSRPGKTVLAREDYSIRSSQRSVTLTGSTELAVEHAAWDLMHQLGYRQFFPGATWEVVPKLEAIRININRDESPDYHFRRIWYGYGPWDHNGPAYRDWCRRNRMGGSVELRSGHAYGGIIRAKQKTFDQHPEFYALLDGKRAVQPQAKLCISNPQLRATVVEYAREYFAERPEEDCISMDPSDGGGWCECEPCQQIGSPSDRALLLANEVADAVKPRLVGMYAYNYHSAPPSLAVRPNVCINAATSFIKGGSTIDQIIAGWSRKGATIGIREYYSVNTWDRDLPGASRGSNLAYLASSIPEFHAQGARFMNAESSDNWGCNGLGYYLASQLLWDKDQAKRREAIVEDFLDKAFGPAKESMREFYELIDGENKHARLVYEDLLARMYRLLQKSREQVPAGSPQQARIDDLILYARYVELFDRYRLARGSERQAAFESMIRHVYRIRGTMMVHAKALYRDVPARDKSVKVPDLCGWQVPEHRNPWKSSKPYAEAEWVAFLKAGVERHQPIELDFKPRQFSEELELAANVVSAPRRLLSSGNGLGSRARGKRSWFTKMDRPGEIVLHIKGGLIAHYRDRGHVKVAVYKLGGSSDTGEQTTLVASDESVPPDGKQRTVRLAIKQAGLYRVDLDDGMDMTDVTWPDGQPMSWKLALDDHPRMFTGRWSLWFYVPEDTGKLGFYVDTSGGRIVDPNGKLALKLDGRKGEFVSVDVPSELAGRLWKLEHVAGRVCLMNAPPYAARNADELLLPKEAK